MREETAGGGKFRGWRSGYREGWGKGGGSSILEEDWLWQWWKRVSDARRTRRVVEKGTTKKLWLCTKSTLAASDDFQFCCYAAVTTGRAHRNDAASNSTIGVKAERLFNKAVNMNREGKKGLSSRSVSKPFSTLRFFTIFYFSHTLLGTV